MSPCNIDADPPGGQIIRDDSGRAIGIFVDNAMAIITTITPPPTMEEVSERVHTGIYVPCCCAILVARSVYGNRWENTAGEDAIVNTKVQ